MPADQDRFDQLADQVRRMAAALESQHAALVVLQTRLGQLEEHSAASREALAETADRLERRLAAGLEASTQVASLAAQLEAARATQTRLAERVEHVAAELGRVARLEDAQVHMRNEVVTGVDAREATLRAEIRALGDVLGRDRTASARALASLVERVETVAATFDRIASLERRQAESGDVVSRLAVRIDEVAAERAAIEAAGRLVEQQAHASIDGLRDEIAHLGEEVGTWRGRIDAQVETVREARAVAESMQAEALRVRDAHHATAEAQRIADGRVEATLEAMRETSDGVWARFLQQRRTDWEQLARDLVARDRRVDELESGVDERLTSLADETARQAVRDAVLADALAALRRDVAEVLGVWREAVSDATAIVEGGLPAGEQTVLAGERREAMRRALRARRPSRED